LGSERLDSQLDHGHSHQDGFVFDHEMDRFLGQPLQLPYVGTLVSLNIRDDFFDRPDGLKNIFLVKEHLLQYFLQS
jgi:hypothetical protein